MLISITDEGCGIPEEKIVKLGNLLYTTKKDGTGLGLMVTSQIIHDHSGTIKFTSQVGQGTSIEVLLPIHQYNQKAVNL